MYSLGYLNAFAPTNLSSKSGLLPAEAFILRLTSISSGILISDLDTWMGGGGGGVRLGRGTEPKSRIACSRLSIGR